jgi:hypothetical protein
MIQALEHNAKCSAFNFELEIQRGFGRLANANFNPPPEDNLA